MSPVDEDPGRADDRLLDRPSDSQLGSSGFRVGHGLDAHRLTPGRPLVIGGIEVPDSPRGADAHSDGDVLLHALSDALLSCYALGDIGVLFPPSDPAFAGLDSREIVSAVLERVRAGAPGVEVVNVAAVVTLDAPKLGPLRDRVAASVARLLGVAAERVGLTFKTSEGLAPDHVQASVTVLVAEGEQSERYGRLRPISAE